MKKTLLRALLLACSFPLFINGIIIESDNLEDVFTYADKDSIVAFDIDDTIAELPLGLAQWIEYRFFELQKMGFDKKEAYEIVLPMFFTINNFVKLVPIGNSPNIVYELQKKDIPVIGLTNRSIPMIERTIDQLESIDIDFSLNSTFQNNMKLSATHMGAFCQDIVFAGFNDKGKMLFLLFKKTGFYPKKIIFVDDRLEQIEAVEKKAIEHNIEFIGIRFSLQDNKKINCDIKNLEKNFYNFKVVLGMEPIA